MAKGLRSSVKKANRSKLRTRVFGPIEAARTERLSAKLLELAQQPKPTRNDMDVDLEKELAVAVANANQASATEEEEPAQQAEGGSLRRPLSYPVPASLCRSVSVSDSASDTSAEDEEKRSKDLSSLAVDESGRDALFYLLLGLSTDVVGFDAWGDLQMLVEH